MVGKKYVSVVVSITAILVLLAGVVSAHGNYGNTEYDERVEDEGWGMPFGMPFGWGFGFGGMMGMMHSITDMFDFDESRDYEDTEEYSMYGMSMRGRGLSYYGGMPCMR